MWEDLIQKAKDGGLDAIDTYVFWNVHEPSPGNVVLLFHLLLLPLFYSSISQIKHQFFFFFSVDVGLQYNFEGRYDLVQFIKTVQKVGLYVNLRIGPYVCAEWNYGFIFFSYNLQLL